MEMGGKRTPVLRRKGDNPSIVIALGVPAKGGMGAPKEAPEMEDEESDTITCPKCGAELADTPENRAYAASKESEDESESEEYGDEGEGPESEDEMED